MIEKGLTALAGLYSAYSAGKHNSRVRASLEEQTGVLKEQLDVIRTSKDEPSSPANELGTGSQIDELV